MRTRKDPEVGRRATTWYTYLRTDRGPVGKWKKRIEKTEDDSCGMCGVRETGWHLAFECPVNEEIRKANINGARTWEDLDDKAMIRKGEWMVEAFFGNIKKTKLPGTYRRTNINSKLTEGSTHENGSPHSFFSSLLSFALLHFLSSRRCYSLKELSCPPTLSLILFGVSLCLTLLDPFKL